MKANRAFRDLAGDDRGVSVVVGALLMAGIFAAVIITFRLEYVPVWEENAEAAHMRTAERQFLAIKTDLDRQLLTGNLTTVSQGITLLPERYTIFGGPRIPHQIAFHPGTASGMALWAPSLTILSTNGKSTAGLDEQWAALSPTATEVTEVSAFDSLRIKLDSLGKEHTGDSFSLALYDSNNVFAGSLTGSVEAVPAGGYYTLKIRVLNRAGGEEYNQGELLFTAETISPYWIDALKQDYRFDRVIAAASAPLRLELKTTDGTCTGCGTPKTLVASYAVAYYQTTTSTGGGTVLVGSTGPTTTNYASSYGGGKLVYTPRNLHYVSTSLILENGAVVADQGNGAAFKVPPSFRASLVGTTTVVGFSLPSLAGPEAVAATAGTASLSFTPTVTTGLVAQGPRVFLNVTTEYPALWASHVREEFRDIGFTEGTEYALTVTGNLVAIDVRGKTSSTSSTTPDISLSINQANIRVDLQG